MALIQGSVGGSRMIVVGYGQSGQSYDFYLFDARSRVWNGSSWVAWDAGDYLTYRLPATQSSPGRFEATVPDGARAGITSVELRFRGATLVLSYLVWTDEVEGVTPVVPSTPGSSEEGILGEIESTAAGPASFSVDGQQVVAQKIPDLIAADKYLTGKRVVRRRGFWGQVSVAKVTPPGAVEE